MFSSSARLFGGLIVVLGILVLYMASVNLSSSQDVDTKDIFTEIGRLKAENQVLKQHIISISETVLASSKRGASSADALFHSPPQAAASLEPASSSSSSSSSSLPSPPPPPPPASSFSSSSLVGDNVKNNINMNDATASSSVNGVMKDIHGNFQLSPALLAEFQTEHTAGYVRFFQECLEHFPDIDPSVGMESYSKACMNRAPQFSEIWWARYRVFFPCPSMKFVGGDLLAHDGPKWTCGIKLMKPGCIVYSWGSNGDTNFEEGVVADTPCTIHIFDPTLDAPKKAHVDQFMAAHPGRAHFYDYGVTGEEQATNALIVDSLHIRNFKTVSPDRFLRLPDILKKLGHENKRIDILKLDIEGHESMLLTEDDSLFKNVDQILVEVHLKFFKDPTDYFTRLMEKMERNHFYLYHSDFFGPCPLYCFEFCFIRYEPGVRGDSSKPTFTAEMFQTMISMAKQNLALDVLTKQQYFHWNRLPGNPNQLIDSNAVNYLSEGQYHELKSKRNTKWGHFTEECSRMNSISPVARNSGVANFHADCCKMGPYAVGTWWMRHVTYPCESLDLVGQELKDMGRPKTVCNLRRLSATCVVFSFGSGDGVVGNFERDLLSKTKCHIYMFDPVPEHRAALLQLSNENSGRVTFHDIGLKPSNEIIYDSLVRDKFQMKHLAYISKRLTFAEILKKVGFEGKKIDILKIDSMEAEEVSLLTFEDSLFANIDQIVIDVRREQHSQISTSHSYLMDKLDNNLFYMAKQGTSDLSASHPDQMTFVRYPKGVL